MKTFRIQYISDYLSSRSQKSPNQLWILVEDKSEQHVPVKSFQGADIILTVNINPERLVVLVLTQTTEEIKNEKAREEWLRAHLINIVEEHNGVHNPDPFVRQVNQVRLALLIEH